MKCEQCDHRTYCNHNEDDCSYFVRSHFKSIEQTNEEWLRSTSTEELAEFLFEIGEYGWLEEIAENQGHGGLHSVDVVKWLKEVHTDDN